MILPDVTGIRDYRTVVRCTGPIRLGLGSGKPANPFTGLYYRTCLAGRVESQSDNHGLRLDYGPIITDSTDFRCYHGPIITIFSPIILQVVTNVTTVAVTITVAIKIKIKIVSRYATRVCENS